MGIACTEPALDPSAKSQSCTESRKIPRQELWARPMASSIAWLQLVTGCVVLRLLVFETDEQMADGPSIRMHEPAEVGLSQAALDRLLPYAESIVGEGRVPNGSEPRAAPSSRCSAPPLTQRARAQ